MSIDQIMRNYPLERAYELDSALLEQAERAARAIFAYYGGYEHLSRVVGFLVAVTRKPDVYAVTALQQTVIAVLADMVGG